MKVKSLLPVIPVLLLVISILPVTAQDTYEFTNASGNGLYSTDANWLLLGSNPPVNKVPYSLTAAAYIPAGQASQVGGVIYLQSLTMDIGGSLNLYGDINIFAQFISGGNINLQQDDQGNVGAIYTNNAIEFRGVTLDCLGSTASFLRPFPASTITVDADTSIIGKLGLIGGYGDSTLINYGSISSNLLGISDPRFFIYPALSYNYGTIQAFTGTSLNYYLNEHHNMDYGVITASTYMACISTQFTNHNLGIINVGGRTDITAATQFNNYGDFNTQQLGVGTGCRLSNYGAGLIQIMNGTLDVSGLMEAGQLTLLNSDLHNEDGALLILSANGASPATAPLVIKSLILDGGTIQSGKLNATYITTYNGHASQLVGTSVSGLIDGSAQGVQVNLTGTTLTGGNIALQGGTNGDTTLSFTGNGANASSIDNVTIQSTGSYGFNLNVDKNSELTLGSNAKVTGTLNQVGLSYGGQSGSKLTNNGLISTTSSGTQTYISPAILINNGAIQASNGASLIFGYGNNLVTNSTTGTISTTGYSNLVIYGGVFHNNGSMSLSNGYAKTFGGTFYTGQISIPNSGIYGYNTSTINVDKGLPDTFLFLYNTAIGNVTGGQTRGAYSYANSTLNMISGQATTLTAFDSGHIIVTGGTITQRVNLNSASVADVSGGQIASAFTNNNSTLNISSGQVSALTSAGNSTINISGGQIGNLSAGALVNVYGINLTKTLVSVSGNVRTYSLNGTLADGTVWTNKIATETGTGNINLTLIVLGSAEVIRITGFNSIIRDGSIIRIGITLTNIGGITTHNVQMTSALLGAQIASNSPLPSVTTLAPGASTILTLAFPAPVSGTKTTLILKGIYQDGNFGGTYRVTIP